MAMIGRRPPAAIANAADIADNAITSAKIAENVITHADVAPNAITASELADDAVDIAALSATGTADNTTFLRGDNSWQIVDTEGTGIKSTGESGGNKFLREDGDGTSSWQTAGSPSITDGGNSTAMTIDSAEDVTFEKRAIIPSLKPKSNQNLTGTYADHEMIMGDQFTLTGDLTINDNLVLASLSGSGQDITITDDGNGRTITTAGKVISCTTTNTDATVTTADTSDLRAGTGVTGTGVPAGATIASVTNATTFELSAAATASGTVNLTFDTAVFEAGEFLGTAAVPDASDISGTFGSGVTIGSGVTYESAHVFPAGHIVQIKSFRLSPDQGTEIFSGIDTCMDSALSFDNPIAAGNHVLIMYNGTFLSIAGGSNGHTDLNLIGGGFGTRDAGGNAVNGGGRMTVDGMFYPEPDNTREHPSITTLDTAPGSTTPNYNVWFSCQLSLTFKISAFDMTLMEIQT